MSFGEKLKMYRESIGITQEAFAEQIGIDPIYLSEIENNKVDSLTETTLIRMVGVLQLTTGESLALAFLLSGLTQVEFNNFLQTFISNAERRLDSLN